MQVATRFPSMEKLIDAADNNTLESLPGVGKVRAATFRQFLKDYSDELVSLLDLGFWVVDATAFIENSEVAGKTFCITGGLPGCSRPEAEEQIRKRGGIAKGNVSRRTDFLVVGDAPGGTKWDAAQRWGTPCLSPEEFFKKLEWYPTDESPDPDKEY
jgi:DNA ligase (NAD+)